MKKISLMIVLIAVCFAANAQYKKASFFNKNGRTFELGTNLHMMGTSKGNGLGFQISQGIDKGKRWFFWSDIEGVLPYDFNYTAQNTITHNNVSVAGRTAFSFIYRFSAGYYFIESTEDKKLLPFATAGISYYATLDEPKVNESFLSIQNVEKRPAGPGYFRPGANAGVGLIYSISKSFSLKASAGYNYQGNFSVTGGAADVYQPFTSHPIFNFNIRYKISSEE